MVADHRVAAGEDRLWLDAIVFCCAIALLLYALHQRRRDEMSFPPRPTEWLTDTSNVLSNTYVNSKRNQLEKWYKDTGHRLVVYLSPAPSDPSLDFDTYTRIVFDSWGVGRLPQNDGVVLFIFTASDMRWIRVGWGLLGAIPDAEATRICTDVIKPLVHLNNWEGAVTAGINAIEADIDAWDTTH